MQQFKVPVGKKEVTVNIPDAIKTKMIKPKEAPIINNVEAAIKEAIINPIKTTRLAKKVKPTDKVAIIVTDITRKLPEDIIVPVLLDELEAAGIPMDNITVVNAIGKHDPNTVEELTEMLGQEVMERVKVINPNPLDSTKLKSLGKSQRGIPIVANNVVIDADIRITTGTIEPHLFAGYSGGIKTFSVGVAGLQTIEATHCVELFEHPNTRLGVIKDNPFREFLTEAAMTAGIDFIINVVQDGQKNLLGVFAGHPIKAYEEGVQLAREIFEVKIDQQYDIVISAPGYPKSLNLYQGTRAWNSVVFGPRSAVKKGGTIIIPTPCEQSFGEQFFYDRLAIADNIQEVIDDALENGCQVGEHKAYITAKVLKHVRVIITDCLIPRKQLEDMFLEVEDQLQTAVDKALTQVENPSVLIMPYGLLTLPVFSE